MFLCFSMFLYLDVFCRCVGVYVYVYFVRIIQILEKWPLKFLYLSFLSIYIYLESFTRNYLSSLLLSTLCSYFYFINHFPFTILNHFPNVYGMCSMFVRHSTGYVLRNICKLFTFCKSLIRKKLLILHTLIIIEAYLSTT